MKNISRRDFLKGTAAGVASIALSGLAPAYAENVNGADNVTKVYFTKEISRPFLGAFWVHRVFVSICLGMGKS